jgi:Glycosyltransferase family 52
MDQVYVCGTYFHIYLSILKTIYTTDTQARKLIVINDRTPGIERIIKPLSESGFFDFAIQVPFVQISKKINKSKFLSRVINRNKNVIQFVEANSDIQRFDEFIKNSEINLFSNLGLSPAYFLLRYKNNFFRMIEDGEGNYISRIGWLQALKRKYILNTVIGEGLDEQVREIEVQFPEKLNKRISKKGKRLELKKMERELGAENLEKILGIFMGDIAFRIHGKKKLLLITQPLSEDGYMGELQKINLYNTLLTPYADQYSVFVKGHPRELTDYHGKLRYEFTMIPKGFPLEMFDLLTGIHFDVALTVSSSSLANMRCVDKKVVIGREFFTQPLPDNWHTTLTATQLE